MKDFELIGIPYGVIVGKKIKDNIVELVDRKSLDKEELTLNEALNKILRYLNK